MLTTTTCVWAPELVASRNYAAQTSEAFEHVERQGLQYLQRLVSSYVRSPPQNHKPQRAPNQTQGEGNQTSWPSATHRDLRSLTQVSSRHIASDRNIFKGRSPASDCMMTICSARGTIQHPRATGITECEGHVRIQTASLRAMEERSMSGLASSHCFTSMVRLPDDVLDPDTELRNFIALRTHCAGLPRVAEQSAFEAIHLSAHLGTNVAGRIAPMTSRMKYLLSIGRTVYFPSCFRCTAGMQKRMNVGKTSQRIRPRSFPMASVQSNSWLWKSCEISSSVFDFAASHTVMSACSWGFAGVTLPWSHI